MSFQTAMRLTHQRTVWAYAFCMGLSFFTTLPARAAGKSPTAAKTVASEQDWLKAWFKGSVEQAFAKAKKEKKPLLLYWGAVWCPPCAELRSQVFSKPRFAELMKPMIAVHIDGDSEAAQTWADKLHVSGYPTVLLFDRDGDESMRINASLSMEEFETAVTSALETSKSLDSTIDAALAQQATPADWRTLAYVSWSQVENSNRSTIELIKARERLVTLVPATMTNEKALIAASLLESAALASTDEDNIELKTYAETVRPQAVTWLNFVLATPETAKASRAQLIYLPGEIVGWAFPKTDVKNTAARADTISRWTAATDAFAKDETLSVDNRLWAAAVNLAFYRLDQPAAKQVPEALKSKLKAAAIDADQRATTAQDRRSVVSGAAYLLRDIGEFDAARAMLENELKRTDTPWYYQSSMANLEKAAGRDQEALEWAAKARQSVKGRASKIQWTVEDLVMTARLKLPDAKEQQERLMAVTRAYYDLALKLPDGFSGRNATRAKRVASVLKPWLPQDKKLRQLIEQYATKCPKATKKRDADGCATHFHSLL